MQSTRTYTSLSPLQTIRAFLAGKRLAMIGVSRDPQHTSRLLYSEFLKQGYEVTPVNPAIPKLDDRVCYPRIQEVQPPVDRALVLLPFGKTDEIIADCAEAGVKTVWVYRAGGAGRIGEAARASAARGGMTIIPGYCPMMFLPNAALFHRIHGAILKLFRQYPD